LTQVRTIRVEEYDRVEPASNESLYRTVKMIRMEIKKSGEIDERRVSEEKVMVGSRLTAHHT
jgi:hypothetical protein